MKTTIDLPDDLFVAAKKRAAEERRPMRELVEQGLRQRLARRQVAAARVGQAPRLRWVVVKGGLPPGLDLRDRTLMHRVISRGQ